MARDYRHGHGQKQVFQRRSQQSTQEEEKRSVSLVWGGVFLVSTVILIGFVITQHFANKAASPEASTEKNIYQAAVEIKETTEAKIETVSKQLQPKPIKPMMVNEVVIPKVDGKSATDGVAAVAESQFSFYEGLGQTEVVVEVEPISVQLEHPFYIQAGSFGSEAVAKQELKRLAQLGLDLVLSPLHKPKRTYYRLRVGPFTDRLLLNKRRNELRQFGVDTLLIKAPKPKVAVDAIN